MAEAPAVRHPLTQAASLQLDRLDAEGGLSLRWQAIVFVLVLLALFSRMPGMLLHPQFYAEDGEVWYAQAYNLHVIHSLTLQQAGYLQTLPRLVTGIVLLFPMLWAPLLMNLAGAAVQVLPVNALLSRRCATWGSMRLRLAMALIYVSIPNAPEIHVVLTNAMWHLVILQLFLAFALPPRTRTGSILELLLFVLGAVSGPFCMLMLLPVAIFWWINRQTRTLITAIIMFCGAILQAVLVHLHPRAPGRPLGAGLVSFLRLLGDRVFTGAMAGIHLPYRVLFPPVPLLVVATLGGLLIVIWGLRSAPLALRLYALFAVITLAASLKDPLIYGALPRWSLLALVPGCRYWYYPSLLFLWCALWCVTRRDFPLARYAGTAVLAILVIALPINWTYPAWPSSRYAYYVDRFQHAPPGQKFVLPIYPEGWHVDLMKR